MSHRQVKRSRRAARTAFVTAISLDLLVIALPVHAQEQDAGETLEEVVVRGVRGAQEAAIDIKRNSSEIVDSIVMEDIGKLPDVTITDALQRVTGIQISRDAGEGSFVSIRGAPQVMATMNGERFLTAENILDSTVSFEDIPASLITGVNVYKSQHAGLTDGGLGGLLDLQSIRALKLEDGFTLSGSAQAGWGSIVDGTDKKFEGVAGFKWSDRVAMSLAASYSDSISASSFQQTEFDWTDEFSSWIVPGDLNGNGAGTATPPATTGEGYVVPNGWNSFVNSREFDRERLGLAYNFNAQLSDRFELIADVFYNDMDEHQHGQQLFVNGNFGGRNIWGAYTSATGDPSILDVIETNGLITRADGGVTYSPDIVTSGIGLTNGLRGGVQSTFRDTNAINTNLELRFGGTDDFHGSVRWIHGKAERNSKAMTVAQQSDSACVVRTAGAACTNLNPSSIPTTNTYEIQQSLGSEQMNYVIGDQLRTLAQAPAAWRLHSSWLESNFTESDMDVFRADGTFKFAESFGLDFGVRYSEREMNEERADYFSPSGLNGLLAKYQEIGYGVAQRQNTAGFDYDPLPFYRLDAPELAPYVTTVSDFNVGGLATGFPYINTESLENPEAFRDALYGEGQYIAAPDRSFGVEEKQSTLYAKFNYNFELSDAVRISGNVGARFVRTEITVFQNLTNPTLPDFGGFDQRVLAGVDPNHGAYLDLGDVYTTTERDKLLPSANLNFDFGNNWRVKGAYYQTQALQPLANLGLGPITYYNGEDTNAAETFQRVNSINRLGNPRLKPWESETFSVNVEWYPRENTIAYLGYFDTTVDSYTYNRQGTDPTAPDSDGVVRRGAVTQDIAQGEGASYYGFEFGYQATFDFLPGFLKNTGANINYTYTPSQAGQDAATGETIILADGSEAPFNGTAENQVNVVLFYQDSRFQARVAANYLSEQYVGAVSHWSFVAPNAGLAQFQESTLYIDAGVSFDVNDTFQVFLQGSNLTEEAPRNYVQWGGNRTIWNQFERVVTTGVRAKF
jgi:TonB-dependent receptor